MNETDDIRGISHYIEHSLFNGSKGLQPQEYDKRLSKIGGYTNASTSFQKTDYYLSLQLLEDNYLEEAIKLNALQTQFPTFSQEQLDREKEPVKAEIDLYSDSATDIATNIVFKDLFNINSKSPHGILGTKDNINSLNREKVLDYFNTWYTPDNAVTVITGDVDVNETINLVAKYYNKQNDYSKINQRYYEPIKYIDKPVRKDIIMPSSTSSEIVMGFPIEEGTSELDRNKISTLFSVLMSNNSHLSKALDKYGLSPSFGYENMQNKDKPASAICCDISLDENYVEDVLKILYDEITYIANNPPSQQELDNIKRDEIYNLNNIAETSSGANDLLTEMLMKNDYNVLNKKISYINSITPQDISQTARKFLDLNKTAICVSHSKTSTPASIIANYNNVNTNHNVSFGSSIKSKELISDFTNQIQQYKLPNNTVTNFVDSPSTTKSNLYLNFESDELDDISEPTFEILNILLNRGNAFKNNETMQNICNNDNLNIGYGVGDSGIIIFANSDFRNLNETLSLIKETLSAPNFTQEEFQRAKEMVKLSISNTNTSSLENTFTYLFPTKKSYASKKEKLKALESITLNDVVNAYYKIFNTAKSYATVNAPIKEYPNIINMFNSTLNQNTPIFRPNTQEKPNSYNVYKPNTEHKIITAPEECTQAGITQTYTFKRTNNIEDKAKILLMNSILGGGLSSRLFKDLREKQNLAYSVLSHYDNINDTGMITLSISTTTESPDPKEGSPENVTKSLEGFERNVNLLKTVNISEDELKSAKMNLKASILNSIETSIDKVNEIDNSFSTPYGIKYNEFLFAAIDKITVDDIRAAANYVFKNQPVTSIIASQKTLDTLNLNN
jgi:predicted Zn-dependent peptidase